VIGARTRGSAVVIGASSGTEATVCMIGMLRGAAPVGTALGHATGKGVPIECLRNAQRPSRLDLQVSTRIQYSSGTRFITTLDELARVGDRPAVVPSGRRASTGSPSPTTPAVRSASSRPSTWPPPRYAIPRSSVPPSSRPAPSTSSPRRARSPRHGSGAARRPGPRRAHRHPASPPSPTPVPHGFMQWNGPSSPRNHSDPRASSG
jgi:hypothetical protein